MFSQIEAEEELNFWRQHNQIIVSTDALKPLEHRQGWSQEKIDTYNKYRIEAVVNADFDLVIIDEAHKMGGLFCTGVSLPVGRNIEQCGSAYLAPLCYSSSW